MHTSVLWKIMDGAVALVRPGYGPAVRCARVWPKAEEFGFANEEAAFALQYGHGVGLSILGKANFLGAWYRSITQRFCTKAWFSPSKRIGRQLTAGAPPASKRKSS